MKCAIRQNFSQDAPPPCNMRLMAGNGKYDWVILDAMGVMYTYGDDVADIMIPYLHKLGSELPDDAIFREFRRCSTGEISSETMWKNCGAGDIDAIDIEYTSFYTLNPNLVRTLKTLREAGFKIACLSNGPGEWSRHLRRRFGLEKWIEKWVISGEVRREKPDPCIYNILLQTIGADPKRCYYVDDNARNIPPAEKLGMSAYLFKGKSPATMFEDVLKEIM
jgi:putative hydrolase of the HAD superfamily